MYDAINDSRVRPSHLALDGIIRRIDDPFWNTHSCPNGYRCRCTLRSLTEAQAHARSGVGKGLNQLPNLPDGSPAEPDPGWDYYPGQDRMEGIRKAMEKRQAKSDKVLSAPLQSLLSQDMKIVKLAGFEIVQSRMEELAKEREEWFPRHSAPPLCRIGI